MWPTWHSQWATDSNLLLEAARPLFESEVFLAAARDMAGTTDVTPRGLYVNLGTPFVAQPVSHTDMPEFRGVDQSVAPGWFLQSMGASGLFEESRIEVLTAVSWFFNGEHGGFRYWPQGRGAPSVHHEATWNTAVMGDNNFMQHKVEKIGPQDLRPSPEMTSEATLDFDGGSWIVEQNGEVIARYADDLVRLSLSWTGWIDDGATGSITIADVFERMSAAIGAEFEAASVDELFNEPTRLQLHDLWPGYLID